MSVAPFILSRPTYTIMNTLVNPIMSVPAGDSGAEPVLRGFFNFLFPVTILLDALVEEIEEGRSFSEEQAGIYESIGRRLSTDYGIDGRTCILRFICELQRRPISKWTVYGQLITELFSPTLGDKKGDVELMSEYRAAQKLGLKEDIECGSVYSRCSVSVFHYFDALQNATSIFDSDADEEEYQSEFPSDL